MATQVRKKPQKSLVAKEDAKDQPKRAALQPPVGERPPKRPKYEEMHEWADEKAKGPWTKYDGGQWIDKFKDKYADNKSFKSLLEMDKDGDRRAAAIAQMKEVVEPRIGGVAREIIEKAKEEYNEETDPVQFLEQCRKQQRRQHPEQMKALFRHEFKLAGSFRTNDDAEEAFGEKVPELAEAVYHVELHAGGAVVGVCVRGFTDPPPPYEEEWDASGPTTAVVIENKDIKDTERTRVRLMWGNTKYTVDFSGRLVVTGVDEGVKVHPSSFMVTPCDPDTISATDTIFSPSSDLTPCKPEPVGGRMEYVTDEVPFLTTLDPKQVEKLKKGGFRDADFCIDETGSECFAVRITNQAEWDMFVCIADGDPNATFIPNPALPLVVRRALANSFRAYQHPLSAQTLHNDPPVAVPAFYAAGGAPIPLAGVTLNFMSVQTIDRLLSRWTFPAAHGSAIGAISGLAEGTCLGAVLVNYNCGAIVKRVSR